MNCSLLLFLTLYLTLSRANDCTTNEFLYPSNNTCLPSPNCAGCTFQDSNVLCPEKPVPTPTVLTSCPKNCTSCKIERESVKCLKCEASYGWLLNDEKKCLPCHDGCSKCLFIPKKGKYSDMEYLWNNVELKYGVDKTCIICPDKTEFNEVKIVFFFLNIKFNRTILIAPALVIIGVKFALKTNGVVNAAMREQN